MSSDWLLDRVLKDHLTVLKNRSWVRKSWVALLSTHCVLGTQSFPEGCTTCCSLDRSVLAGVCPQQGGHKD